MSKKAVAAKNSEEKIYEVGYHILSSVAEELLPSEVEKIKSFLAKEKAVIISEETPKLRPLAYPIKKSFSGSYKVFDKAYFGFIKFELGEDADVRNIDVSMKADESVLRYIIVKTVRENTMYSPKITVYTGKDEKAKTPKVERTEKVEKPASIEEIDKSIDALVSEEVLEK